jgi:predicted transcriptional regulator
MEIYFDILNVMASGEEKPTRIMYRANLSWRALQTILSRLIEEEFIEVEGARGKRYRITEKGHLALNYYRRAVKDLKTSEIMLDVQ